MSQISVIIMMLSTLFFTFSPLVLAAPLPADQSFDKRIKHSGRGTWFYDGLGACGRRSSNSDSIVALSAQIFDAGAHCDQLVRVTNTANGRVAFGMVLDRCQTCGPNDLDMSVGLFDQLGDLNAGVLPITWNFMPKESTS